MSMRFMVTAMPIQKLWSTKPSHNACPTPHGGGKRYGGQICSFANSAQRPMSVEYKIACLASFFIGILLFQRLVNLRAQAIENLTRGARDLGIFHVPRPWQIYEKFLLHAP